MGQGLHAGEAHFLQDDPVPIDGQPLRLLEMLRYVAEQVHDELLVVTPYLIPREPLLASMEQLTARGVEVHLLTASLASRNSIFASQSGSASETVGSGFTTMK